MLMDRNTFLKAMEHGKYNNDYNQAFRIESNFGIEYADLPLDK